MLICHETYYFHSAQIQRWIVSNRIVFGFCGHLPSHALPVCSISFFWELLLLLTAADRSKSILQWYEFILPLDRRTWLQPHIVPPKRKFLKMKNKIKKFTKWKPTKNWKNEQKFEKKMWKKITKIWKKKNKNLKKKNKNLKKK